MKSTCLFLLAVLFGLGAFYYWYLSGTDLRDKWWIGPLLALSVTAFLGNLQGLYFAIRQKIVSGKPETKWKDGDFVGLSGRIQAKGDPIKAPFSGKNTVITEYELKRVTRSGDSTHKSACIRGMLMAPCSVQTMRRSVKIVGFPMLVNLGAEVSQDETHYRNAANYIVNTKFEELASNPVAIVKRLSELLGDEDGDLKADFKDKDFYVSEEFNDEHEEGSEGQHSEPQAGNSSREEDIYRMLIGGNYDLEETNIENGTEVTVFGTYRANRQAVDIGSGFSNLQHSIQLGKLDAVVNKNIIKSLIFSAVFGGICIWSHIYIARSIGFNI